MPGPGSVMIFQRKGPRLAPWYGPGALFWLFAAVFVLAFLVGLFGIGPLKWTDYLVIALIGFLAVPPARLAWSTRKWVQRVETSYLRFDDQCVEFRFFSASAGKIRWTEVQAVTRKKRWVKSDGPLPFAYRNVIYTLLTTCGPFTFSSMEIPRPARAARTIAAKLGKGSPEDSCGPLRPARRVCYDGC